MNVLNTTECTPLNCTLRNVYDGKFYITCIVITMKRNGKKPDMVPDLNLVGLEVGTVTPA